jgi:hypothetical protein
MLGLRRRRQQECRRFGWPHNACRIVISISLSTLARRRGDRGSHGAGFTVETNWRPVRIELRRHLDLWVDIHTSLLAAVLVLA